MNKKEKTVAYFYDEEVGNFCYGGGNPMRPHRVRLTHSLVHNYGLTKQLIVHRPRARTFEEITEFHADEYVDFLKNVTPDNQDEYMVQLRRFNMGIPGEADCPVFDGLYNYCQVYSGGSVDGAAFLANQQADIALNWSGGMHHAKKAEASGFCYINDIVLAILELLKVHARVLYVDIDIHHGDGVEEAFYLTDRVMTVSFHKYGDFFPGTGALEDIGVNKGKCYCVNVPLKEGMDDESYRYVFEPVMAKVMEMYAPGAIVVCAGADSLSGDRLGCFNLSLEGHSNCLEFLSKFAVPMLVLGGGGYTMRNVARCWCYETGRLMGVDLPDSLPDSALSEYNYYLDTQRLRIAVSNMRNANTQKELEDIKHKVLENLRHLAPVPSVQFKRMPALRKLEDNEEEDMELRGGSQAMQEQRRVKEEEDSDDEEPQRTNRLRQDRTYKEEEDDGDTVPMDEDLEGGEGEQHMQQRSDDGSDNDQEDGQVKYRYHDGDGRMEEGQHEEAVAGSDDGPSHAGTPPSRPSHHACSPAPYHSQSPSPAPAEPSVSAHEASDRSPSPERPSRLRLQQSLLLHRPPLGLPQRHGSSLSDNSSSPSPRSGSDQDHCGRPEGVAPGGSGTAMVSPSLPMSSSGGIFSGGAGRPSAGGGAQPAMVGPAYESGAKAGLADIFRAAGLEGGAGAGKDSQHIYRASGSSDTPRK